MEKTIERVKNISEYDAKKIIGELRNTKLKSISLETFVADYLNTGRYCIVNNDENKECVPCQHRELLVNFLLNLDALLSDGVTFTDKAMERVKKAKIVQVNEEE